MKHTSQEQIEWGIIRNCVIKKTMQAWLKRVLLLMIAGIAAAVILLGLCTIVGTAVPMGNLRWWEWYYYNGDLVGFEGVLRNIAWASVAGSVFNFALGFTFIISGFTTILVSVYLIIKSFLAVPALTDAEMNVVGIKADRQWSRYQEKTGAPEDKKDAKE